MANIYTSLDYDLVFSTENREPSLIESVSHLDKWSDGNVANNRPR